MALKEAELNSLANILEKELKGQRMSKIIQFDNDVFSFSLSKSGRLVFCINQADPYVYLSSNSLEVTSLSTPFSALLRKEASNALIEKVSLLGEDRIIEFELWGVDSLFRECKRTLVFEAIPTKTNLILLDESNRILGALRTSTFSDSRPILRGLGYTAPLKKEGLTHVESGFDYQAYLYSCLKKEEALSQKRKKTKFQALYLYSSSKLKSLKRKQKAIEQDISNAKSHLNDGEYGSYLYTNKEEIDISKGSFSFYGEEVPLDPRKSLSGNAEAFFKRAKKAKSALLQGEKYLEEAIKEQEKCEHLLAVLDSLDEASLEKLSKEYGLENKFNVRKDKVDSPLFQASSLPFVTEIGGTRFCFGKNSAQNDFLSFLWLTKKDNYWFHVKDNHGAHLILDKENPTKEEISLACQIALLASSLEEGEVMYTLHKNVRRGNVKGQAIVKEYESAYFRKIEDKARTAFESAKMAQLKRKK